MRAKAVYVLSADPLILAGSFGSYTHLGKIGRPFHYIYHNPGWIWLRSVPRYLRIHQEVSRLGRVTFVTNEPSEARWLRLCGLDAVALNQNLHIRENFFTPGDGVHSKRYNAVYAAQLAGFKRLHLAKDIDRLMVVTYKAASSEWDLHDYEPRLRHAEFNRTYLDREAVRDVYRDSVCGLALSAVEGAMWASMEYLMCGIPVVSTPNRGGRDRYLTGPHAREVDAEAAAVASAVAAYRDVAPDPMEIRGPVLEMIEADRLRYLELLGEHAGMSFGDAAVEARRLWGGVEGIERHAVELDVIHKAFN